MANIKARRKLSDLFRRGVEVRFGPDESGQAVGTIAPGGEGEFKDEDGKPIRPGPDDVQAWVQPPSPLHREMAMRTAQAARAKALVRAKRDEESEEHLTILAFLADMTDETLLEYVVLQGADERHADAMREILGEDEWKDMTAYQDAMREFDESGKTLEELEEDPEWVAMMDLDIKFGAQVSDRSQEMADAEREALRMQLISGRGNLERKALIKRADMVGTQAFMYEYERQMLYYSVRDFDDRGVMFYGSATEMAEEDEEVRNTYQRAMAPFITDSGEAKNLQGVVSGSGSSELPSEPETSESSIPETASA